MKTKKLYFENKDSNICYPLQYHLERSKEEGLKEIELFEAIHSSETDYIWFFEVFNMLGRCFNPNSKRIEARS